MRPPENYPYPEPEEPKRWQESAACRWSDPEIFFIDRGQSTLPAKMICRECVVIEPCLEMALADTRCPGVFGGTSERERRFIRRGRRHGIN